jgi:hypothetical protein
MTPGAISSGTTPVSCEGIGSRLAGLLPIPGLQHSFSCAPLGLERVGQADTLGQGPKLLPYAPSALAGLEADIRHALAVPPVTRKVSAKKERSTVSQKVEKQSTRSRRDPFPFLRRFPDTTGDF